jgi:hypothetical protein
VFWARGKDSIGVLVLASIIPHLNSTDAQKARFLIQQKALRMAKNSIETVWILQLDEEKARQSENTIARLARAVKDKLGVDGKKAIDQTTEAIEDQTRALKDAEKQAEKTGASYEDRLKRVKEGGADFSGDVASATGGLRGAVDTFSGGNSGAVGKILEFGEAIADVGEYAPQAATQIMSLAGSLGPVGLGLAAVAAIAAAAIVAASQSIQAEADRITAVGESRLAVAERVAAGLSTEDALAEMEANARRREEINDVLIQAQQEYNDFLAQQPDVLGNAGDNLLKIFDSREAAFEKAVLDAQGKLKEIASDDQALKEAIDNGKTTTEKAVEAEKKLADSRSTSTDTTREAETAQRVQEKAASDATRAVEQQAAKQEQAAQKQYAAAQKYGDAMVDIANKTADSAKAALDKQRQALADNQTGLQRDLAAISTDFAASEREQQIERMEQEAADLRKHANTLNQIRDAAEAEEIDLLRQRDFLGATKVRERANAEIEQQNKTLVEAQQEKIQLQREADAKELRELQDARLKRLTQFRQQNEDARLAYQRDLVAGREARRIAERDAALARNRELKMASDTARAMLGIQSQFNQAQIQMAQNSLNQLRGVSNTTNNSRTINGGINMPIYAAPGGMSATAIQNQIYAQLDGLGLTRP